MIKKWDIAIILILILFSFLPQLIFGILMGNQSNETYAEITIHGSFYKKIPLSSHTGVDEFVIKTKYGFNKIKIKDHSIAVIDADCKDKICIKQGAISKAGQTIACLPHQLLIEIKNTSKKKQTIIPVG